MHRSTRPHMQEFMHTGGAFCKAPFVQQILAAHPQSAADVEQLYYSLHLDLA